MKKITYLLALIVSICLSSCEKEVPMNTVQINLQEIKVLPPHGVLVKGTINCNGVISGSTPIRYGLAIASHPDPTIFENYWYDEDTIVADPNKWPSEKEFTLFLNKDYTPGSFYYVRAMVLTTSEQSVIYGNEMSFSVPKDIPTLERDLDITVRSSETTVTFRILNDAGYNITECGIQLAEDIFFTEPSYSRYFPTDPNVVLNNSATFKVTKLKSNTKYYVCAYARNSKGTGYSDIWEFTTN